MQPIMDPTEGNGRLALVAHNQAAEVVGPGEKPLSRLPGRI